MICSFPNKLWWANTLHFFLSSVTSSCAPSKFLSILHTLNENWISLFLSFFCSVKQHTGWDSFIDWMGILGSRPGLPMNPAFYGMMYFYSYKINLTHFKLEKKNEEYFILSRIWKNEQTCCPWCHQQGSFIFLFQLHGMKGGQRSNLSCLMVEGLLASRTSSWNSWEWLWIGGKSHL